ncbi:MAG: hypothetical protein DLM59_17455 [Pseudonocardiales bacterium]|nr:MAG: hypothetical protein DLM59_17455 [Pseudonocardiales bacterium]
MRSGLLVAWTRSWQAGLVSYDEVLDVVQAGGQPHRVTGAIGDVALGRLLMEVRADRPRLVLPVPGDPRGLPGPGPYTSHALAAGEAVLAGGWGLVPEAIPPTVLWHSYAVPAATPDLVPLADADAELAEALRDSASALGRLDVAGLRPELAGALAAIRRPASDAGLPPGYPARAHRLLALADRIGDILRLAAADAPGAAVTASAAVQRDDLLRPVAAAARRARLAAYNTELTS